MKKILLFVGILLMSNHLFAQEQETVFGYSGLKLTGVWGGPAFSLGGIGAEEGYYRGGFFGLEFNKQFNIGYAAYWLDERAEIEAFPDQDFDLSYKGVLLGYAPNARKLVHPKFSLLVGGGRVDIENQDLDRVLIIQPAGGIEINIFKWWHVDVLGGYRIARGADITGLSDNDLSAPFAELRMRFGISWGW